LKKFVERGANMNKDMYSLPEMIKPNYVTPAQVKKMIDVKYRRGSFNIKSEDEIKKLYEVAENVFNYMEDPGDALKTVSGNYGRNLTKKLYEISNNVGQQQLQNIINDNIKTENEFQLNVSSQSSSLAAFPNSFQQEPKLIGEFEESGGENEDDTESATGGESGTDIESEYKDDYHNDNESEQQRNARLKSQNDRLNELFSQQNANK
jgi:hypothetical protein